VTNPDARPATKSEKGLSKREQTRLAVALVAGGLAVVFAVLNFDKVKVNWIFGTWSTPLVLVIAVSFLLGMLVGVFVWRRRSKRAITAGKPDD
jgi:uncharacterized integral membrane protein